MKGSRILGGRRSLSVSLLLIAGALGGGLAAANALPMYWPVPPPVAPIAAASLPTERVIVPMIFPVLRATGWSDTYNKMHSGFRHSGEDIRAPKMRPIVAPFRGQLGFKLYSFWIQGDNGWRVLGTHLNDDTPGTNDNKALRDFMFAPNIRFGDTVEAGQLIGYVGNSTNATGPHLHFELYGPHGIRNPRPSLNLARHIAHPILHVPNIMDRPAPGETRIVGCPRTFAPDKRVLWIAVVARQDYHGKVMVCEYPHNVRLLLSEEQIEQMRDADDGAGVSKDRAISFYVGANSQVTRLSLPDESS